MIRDFVEWWTDERIEALMTCHYPDHNGSLSVWDNHFVGSPQ